MIAIPWFQRKVVLLMELFQFLLMTFFFLLPTPWHLTIKGVAVIEIELIGARLQVVCINGACDSFESTNLAAN
jgi:hypothetical protein